MRLSSICAHMVRWLCSGVMLRGVFLGSGIIQQFMRSNILW